MLDKSITNHIVARVVGVTKEDTRISAAEKTLKLMRDAGFSKLDIAKAQAMIDAAKARGVK